MDYKEYVRDLKSVLDMAFEQDIRGVVLFLKSSISLAKDILVCGNGGSASMSDHFVIDFQKMSGYTGIQSLSANNAVITAHANDDGYANVFSNQIQRRRNIVLLAISSSGRSQNVLEAAKKVHTLGGTVITITGCSPENPLLSLSDFPLVIPSKDTQIIEDVTSALLHAIARGMRC